MLPNDRVVAVGLLALLLLQGLPVASAQETGPDLYVSSVTVTSQAVLNRAATVVVVVENRGTADFVNGNFNVLIGHDSPTNCLDASDPQQPNPNGGTSDPLGNNGCRFEARNVNVGRSTPLRYTFQWTPVNGQEGDLNIHSQLCGVVGTNSGCNPGPETTSEAQANNLRTDHVIRVAVPSIDAVAKREVPPHPGADIDDVWREANITADCPTGQGTVVRLGCKAVPGQVLVYEYDVINRGNVVDTVAVSILGADAYAKRGIRFIPSSNTLSVDPFNGTRTLTVTVEIPPNATSTEKINIGSPDSWLVIRSGLDPTKTTADTPGGHPPMPSILLKRTFGLLVHTNDTSRVGNKSEDVRFRIEVNNTGNSKDSFRFKFLEGTGSINGSWNLPAPTDVQLDAFTKRAIDVYVRPPANASKGLHQIDLEIASTNDTTGAAYAKLPIVVDLQQHYNLTASADVGLISRLPAETARFVVRLKNEGNGWDNVTLDQSILPPGWSGGVSSRVVALPPFGIVPVYVNITPPANAPRGAEAYLFVNATSSGPIDRERAKLANPLMMQVRVLEGSNLDVQGGGEPTFVDPGQTTNYTLRVTNTGNVRDRFTVELTPDDPAWGASATPESIPLDPLQSAAITVSLRAPTTAAVGETASLLTKVVSGADRSRERSLTLGARVSGPDLFVATVLPNSTNPYTGDPLQVSVSYGNTGNKAPATNATLKLFFVQSGVEREIGSLELTPNALLPGVRRTELFTWADTASTEGVGVLVARIDTDAVIAEIDESDTSNAASADVTLRTFDIRLRPAEGQTGRPGEKVVYGATPNVFLVKYSGNQPTEPVRIIVESENGWFSSDLSVNLQRDVDLEVLAEVQIPVVPGVAEDVLRVTVIPTYRPTSTLVATTTTTVLDDAKPRIGGLAISPTEVSLGEAVNLSAVVTDATGLRSVRAFVVTPTNETIIVPLFAGDEDRWSATHRFESTGLHRVYIEAIDGSAAGNSNSTRDTVVSFTVTPGSAPVIRLADGQSSTVRTGASLRLNITDPLGVGRVTYTIRGIEYDLSAPYHVDTSSFPGGPLNLTVKATNIFGAESTQRFDLVVDNSPPGIRRVSVSPEQPRVNEDVTVRIETDAGVESVSVVLKRDGQVVETRSATKRSDGVFELLLNPGRGDYVIDVSAQDGAGNTQVKPEAVLFSAKPASFVPGAGIGLLAAAVALVALALRRRQ